MNHEKAALILIDNRNKYKHPRIDEFILFQGFTTHNIFSSTRLSQLKQIQNIIKLNLKKK